MKNQTNWAHFIAGQIGICPYSESIPGMAKTESHQTLALMTQRNYIPVMLSQKQPEDLGGFPEPGQLDMTPFGGHGSKRVVARTPDQDFLLASEVPSLMLIDEFTCVGPRMQAAALTWMCAPPENCWVFAAGNPADFAADGQELTAPMVNRMCLLEWEFDRDTWANGMKSGGFDFPSPEIPIVPDDWRENVPLYAEKINLYVNSSETELSREEYLIKYPGDGPNGLPYATPRSWTRLAWLLGAADSVGANERTKRRLAAGMVGEGLGPQFLDFMQAEGLRNPEDILDDPKNVDVPVRGSMATAYVGSVIRRVRMVNTPERWEAARVFLAAVHKQNPEIAQVFKGPLWSIKPDNYAPLVDEYFSDMEAERIVTIDN